MRKSGFRIAFIGAGKVAWSLIPALTEKGYKIKCIISNKITDAEKAAVKFGIRKFSDDIQKIPDDTNIIFLTVPDDKIEKTAEQISENLTVLKNITFIHFSGVYESDVLKAIEKRGGITASFHIMQTFPSRKRVNIKNNFASFQTEYTSAKEFLSNLASDLGINAFEIKGGKTAYHLSGVFASNFLTANLYNAEKLFRETGSNINFYEFIDPIIKKTLLNIYKSGAVNSLSGPVERNDIRTITLHINYLKKKGDMLLYYLIQSLNLVKIKKEREGTSSTSDNLELYLKKELSNYLKRSIR